MAITKGNQDVFASQTVSSGSSETSSWIDLTEKQAATLLGDITNGGSGPSSQPTVTIQVADDNSGTNTRTVEEFETPTDNSAVTPFEYRFPITTRFARVTVDNTGGGGNDITVDANLQTVDALG